MINDEKEVTVNHDTGETIVTERNDSGVTEVTLKDGEVVRVQGQVTIKGDLVKGVLPPDLYA